MSVFCFGTPAALADSSDQFEYTSEYLPDLVALCVRRRQENMERWKSAGGKVGISEWDFLPAFEPSAVEAEQEPKVIAAESTYEVTPQAHTSQGPPVKLTA